MQIIKSSTVTWIDVVSPSYKDVHRLMHDFHIHPMAATQLKDPTFQPAVETFDAFLYITLHFPILNKDKGVSEGVEIDFIITPHMLLTNHYTDIEPLNTLLRKCSFVKRKDSANCLDNGPMFLFYTIVNELFKFSQNEIDYIHKEIEAIEDGIFDDRKDNMVPRISRVRRDVINFVGALKPQRMVLENLLQRNDFVDRQTAPFIASLLQQYDRLLHLIDTKREMIEALQATNESILNTKTNDIMKTLTIMAFVTFPLMLLGTLFGMNTVTAPIIGLRGDFWIIVAIMAFATIGFFAFFKAKKWL